MAIVKEFYVTRRDGINLYKTYSDEGYQIRKIGTEEVYDEAIDIETSNHEYEETRNKIDTENNIEEKAIAYDILVGEVE